MNQPISAVVLYHPSSRDLIPDHVLEHQNIKPIRISCGASKVAKAQYSESSDFSPSYATWNSALFETSVILTIWEHADALIQNNNVAILHSDVIPHFDPSDIWQKVDAWISEDPSRSVGLVVPQYFKSIYDDWLLPDTVPLTVEHDPMFKHAFDNNIYVWDFIKKYDYDIFEYAMDVKPRMIYSHQFACSRPVFDQLGQRLHNTAHKLRLHDIGLWTAHVFERLIGLYLSAINPQPIISTAFWHYCSSKSGNPESMNLYGPRPLKYYKICSRTIKSI